MKFRLFILQFLRSLLVVICFLAISSNLYSFYFTSNVKENIKVKKEQKESDENEDDVRYSAYEAVVPAVHFNPIFFFCFISKVIIVETPARTVEHSPPFFTRAFYRTLFQSIISPNAP